MEFVPVVITVTETIPSHQIVAENQTRAPERTTARKTLNEAEESDAPIYVMEYDTMAEGVRRAMNGRKDPREMQERFEWRRDDYVQADSYLRALAGISGGRLYPADRPPGIDEAFNQIRAELRQQYSLGYYPKKSGQPNETREIKVRVSRPDVVVRARLGYVYALSKP